MQCERCKSLISEGEQMDLLSLPRICDPWAVYSAMTFLKNGSSELSLNSVQQKILEILQDEGP